MKLTPYQPTGHFKGKKCPYLKNIRESKMLTIHQNQQGNELQ